MNVSVNYAAGTVAFLDEDLQGLPIKELEAAILDYLRPVDIPKLEISDEIKAKIAKMKSGSMISEYKA